MGDLDGRVLDRDRAAFLGQPVPERIGHAPGQVVVVLHGPVALILERHPVHRHAVRQIPGRQDFEPLATVEQLHRRERRGRLPGRGFEAADREPALAVKAPPCADARAQVVEDFIEVRLVAAVDELADDIRTGRFQGVEGGPVQVGLGEAGPGQGDAADEGRHRGRPHAARGVAVHVGRDRAGRLGPEAEKPQGQARGELAGLERGGGQRFGRGIIAGRRQRHALVPDGRDRGHLAVMHLIRQGRGIDAGGRDVAAAAKGERFGLVLEAVAAFDADRSFVVAGIDVLLDGPAQRLAPIAHRQHDPPPGEFRLRQRAD